MTPADVDAVAHVFVAALAEHLVIDGADGHHLQRVRRLEVDECITAADGTGGWAEFTVVASADGRIELDARSETRVVPQPAIALVLAAALTKGGLDAVVASATELGVDEVVPVQTARTIVRWDATRAEHAVGRLQAVAREAAMQSRRARIPTVRAVASLETIAARRDLVVADRTGSRAEELSAPTTGSWCLLVGPEGGLAPDERKHLADHPHLRLGDHVLRATTAPIAGLVILGDRIAQMGHT